MQREIVMEMDFEMEMEIGDGYGDVFIEQTHVDRQI